MNAFLSKEIKDLRSQDLPPYYRLNGAIYVNELKLLRDQKSLFPNKGSVAYIMERDASLDIDSEIDLRLAEIILKAKNNLDEDDNR